MTDAVETLPPAAPEMVKVSMVLDSMAEYYRGRQANLSSGLVNATSGMGGLADKSAFFQFLPYWLNSRQFIQNILIQSWAAERFTSMPINDMFTQPREYDDERFAEYAARVEADNKLAAAMRLARKYGTGILWAVTREAPPEEPLDVSRIRPGDLINLISIDRYDVSIHSRNEDILSENFGKPEWYRINLHMGGTFTVHASRLYRFDGITSDTANGWMAYEKDWGISAMAHAMVDIFNDSSVSQAVCHLIQEASIPVQKVDGLSEMLCQGNMPDEPTIEERMATINTFKSIYRTMFMDARDEFSRESVSFTNVPDLIEKFADRLAMMSGISATRFLNKSPDGQNSTGQGDMRNDNRTTAARQLSMLEPAYTWLDAIVAASAGTVPPEYRFPPLFEPTQEEVAKTIDKRADSATKMTSSAVWDEDEAREYVATGILPDGPAPEVEEEPEPVIVVAPEEEVVA
jgi:phage-related protein (TIGR01555 family)